jgi:hypothetical protein
MVAARRATRVRAPRCAAPRPPPRPSLQRVSPVLGRAHSDAGASADVPPAHGVRRRISRAHVERWHRRARGSGGGPDGGCVRRPARLVDGVPGAAGGCRSEPSPGSCVRPSARLGASAAPGGGAVADADAAGAAAAARTVWRPDVAVSRRRHACATGSSGCAPPAGGRARAASGPPTHGPAAAIQPVAAPLSCAAAGFCACAYACVCACASISASASASACLITCTCPAPECFHEPHGDVAAPYACPSDGAGGAGQFQIPRARNWTARAGPGAA